MKQSGVKAFIDRNALLLAMILGAVGFPIFRHLTCLLPPMIFLMLFFTFCKVNPLDLRLHRWHWLVLTIQLILTGLTFYGVEWGLQLLNRIYPLSPNAIHTIAQGIMVCVIMPTATAAPIIAGKLGGSIQNLTAFTLLSNIATAIVVPAFFPIVNPEAGIDFINAAWMILRKVAPLLIGPFLSAWILRVAYNAYQRKHNSNKTFSLSHTWATLPFYLWAGTLIILMAEITYTLIHQHYSAMTIFALCLGALLTCTVQFLLGRWIGWHFPAPNKGEDYHDVLIDPNAANYSIAQVSQITAGQAFGQKNTTLGVWMAQTYLLPIAAIGPAAYIIWQNLINSIQLSMAAKHKQNTTTQETTSLK